MLGDHFPIQRARDYNPGDNILGICCDGFNFLLDDTIPMLGYMFRILAFAVIELQRIKRQNIASPHTIIDIVVDDTPIVNFVMTDDAKRDMFMTGYDEVKNKYRGFVSGPSGGSSEV